ncbi:MULTISPECIES: antitoxin VbhA family protein [Sulfitobacter]|uniref:Antitoxin VbhA domain-containing protein n=1 Tax=Sulfitobacter dubius TaxID=218673 RepID=A0ABY3ZR24_9RHOB|nr:MULTISPECIES: antitoxin VbhA family protein [Sulfitobacter]UOA16614.1 hypothetical protein DSM109990_03498 [Sulfitobacter dubius]UOA33675.1 hypothetical protein DSM110093_03510 [Sulfitobacter sp. DSM 110093]UOA33936.1 hypothetical protein DSM110093_03771 [Sulfitobacter sp. DSM 110093]
MACTHKSYDETASEDRRTVVASAINSQRLEGLELDVDTLADLDNFISGKIDLAQVKAKIEARFDRLEPSI